jgi:hypothetical protein
MARKIQVSRYNCTGKAMGGKVDITFNLKQRGVWCLWKHVAPYIKELSLKSTNKQSDEICAIIKQLEKAVNNHDFANLCAVLHRMRKLHT